MRALYRLIACAFVLPLALLILSGGARAADIAEPAAQLVGSLSDRAMTLINQRSLSPVDRAQQFEALFAEQFDVPGIARFAIGHYWRQLSPAQQSDYLQLFQAMVVKVYAERFADARGSSVRVTGQRMEGDDVALVTTEVIQPGSGQATRVGWRVRPTGGALKIIDVVVEGVSMCVTEQQEFSAVIQRNGGQVEALLQRMRDHIAAH